MAAGWTHSHHGIVSNTEYKYILTGWYSFRRLMSEQERRKMEGVAVPGDYKPALVGTPYLITMINFDDMELMQLQFCMSQTKKMMAHPSEHMRHESITKKVEEEMQKRTKETGAYTREGVLRQLQKDIEDLQSRMD